MPRISLLEPERPTSLWHFGTELCPLTLAGVQKVPYMYLIAPVYKHVTVINFTYYNAS
jgi:hypothetical protein